MDQHIGFCAVDGGRIAYATTGAGPPLVFLPWWVSHLEVDWQAGSFRSFVEALSAHHTVIRYDRLGTGLSDRERPAEPADARRARSARSRRSSTSSASTARRSSRSPAPARSRSSSRPRTRERDLGARLLRRRTPTARASRPNEVERLMIAAVRTHWGMGVAHARRRLPTPTRPRRSARRSSASSARRRRPRWRPSCSSSSTPADVRDLLPALERPDARHAPPPATAPCRSSSGASWPRSSAGARFVPLDGRTHVPWSGQSGDDHRAGPALPRAAATTAAAAAPSEGVLSDREPRCCGSWRAG